MVFVSTFYVPGSFGVHGKDRANVLIGLRQKSTDILSISNFSSNPEDSHFHRKPIFLKGSLSSLSLSPKPGVLISL